MKFAASPVAVAAVLGLALVVGCGIPQSSDGTKSAPDELSGDGVTCVGVFADKCAELVREVKANGVQVPTTSIRIVCTAPPCTVQQGQVTIDVLYANGKRMSTGSNWAPAAPHGVPPTPVLTQASPGPLR